MSIPNTFHEGLQTMTIRTHADLERASREARTQDRDMALELAFGVALVTLAAAFGIFYLVAT